MSVAVLCAATVSIFQLGCSSSYVESDVFRVVVDRLTLANDNISVRVTRKGMDEGWYTFVNVEGDDSVDIAFLDDSTFLITDIWASIDGYPALITNFQAYSRPVNFKVGASFVADDTSRLSTLESGESVASSFQKNSRPDIFFVTAYAPASPYPYGYLICLLGAQSTELVSVTDTTLVFDCIWQRQPSRQRFEVDLSDGLLEPGDFRIVEGT